jgi:hypothetical protein
MQALYDALALAEPSGFIRIFVDEGLTITLANTGHTLLTGPVLDPAAQSGLLKRYGIWACYQSRSITLSPPPQLRSGVVN